MGRRIASQVHQQAGRLLRGKYLKERPAWYQAALDHPPLPLPPRQAPARTDYDTDAAQRPSAAGERPLPIRYLQDEVRRQFFRDHPFEAFRPVSIVENGRVEEEHPVRGSKWERLRQRGRNPRPEDAIQFTVSLHEHHGLSLSRAYSTAVAQFRALRAEHHVMATFAAAEAAHYGAIFAPSLNETAHRDEVRALGSWAQPVVTDEGAAIAAKKWAAVVQKSGPVPPFTKGAEYVRLWRAGVRPNYVPQVVKPEADVAWEEEEEPAPRGDFMRLMPGQNDAGRSTQTDADRPS